MTPSKNDEKIGWRPEVMECLQAWLRCVESDPTRVAPKRLRSNAQRQPDGKPVDPRDEYCRERVQEAVTKIGSPTQADLLLDIAAHRMSFGTVAGWKCFSVIAISPASTKKQAKFIQTPGAMPRLSPDQVAGMELYMLALNSFYAFRSSLQECIDEAKPFVDPPPEECEADREKTEKAREARLGAIKSRTW